MKQEKVGVLLLQVLVFALSLCEISSSSGSYFDQQQQYHRRKSMLPTEASSSLMLNRAGSSIVLPVDGNVYPIGFYNVTLNVGQPSKPYFLDPDTGSDLTWLQCEPCVQCTEAPHPPYRHTNNLVACKDPLCKSLHPTGDYKCETPEQCDYEIDYADGVSSMGFLVKDLFSLNLTNGGHLRPHLALGCGYDQSPSLFSHPSDGILGLGKGKSSIISQLSSQGLVRNVVGHCLSGRGGGYFFFGNDLYDASRVVWTSMSRDHREHYSPGFAELIFGGKPTGIRNLLVVFDSGSSYTYLTSKAYEAVTSLVKKELPRKHLREALDDKTLPYCWSGRRRFKSIEDVVKYFKPLALSFANGGKAKHFAIPPEAYLIISVSPTFIFSSVLFDLCLSSKQVTVYQNTQTTCLLQSKGNVCLGILNGTEAGQSLNIIGDISMLGKMVIYDNEKQLIGWVSDKCDRLPKPKTVGIW
ncbi:aspartic proteinase Asp1-like isoform X1 [Juglans microcarpa x Juglans regia]|uniref:aspartic proteinase Asp1-like isoform X1 n=1 Tax=Juglans microcarpa x Juglans regia TaxID=2249226 RepID=UPI001B7EF8C5|nr:aspartic proteinase Asp1-like isoform X1 [Juglans microcarpa x Juglans regia]